MEGPSIRDYIDARKKSGLSWEEFRALKEQGNENEFSTSAMADWRKQLDAEREAKLSKSIGRKVRRKDTGREGDGSDREHKRRQSSKHRHHRRTHHNHSKDRQNGGLRHRTGRHHSRSRSRSRSQDRAKRRHRRSSRSQSPVRSHGRKEASKRVSNSDDPNAACTESDRRDKEPKTDV